MSLDPQVFQIFRFLDHFYSKFFDNLLPENLIQNKT